MSDGDGLLSKEMALFIPAPQPCFESSVSMYRVLGFQALSLKGDCSRLTAFLITRIEL